MIPISNLVDLGACIARVKSERGIVELNIMSPSISSEHSFQPASDVTVFGKANVIKLRDALTVAIDRSETPPPTDETVPF